MNFEESFRALELRIETLRFQLKNSKVPSEKEGHTRALKNQKTKYELYLKNPNCCFCDNAMFADSEFGKPPKNKIATIEHILPKSKGGTNHKDNLTLSCYSCNSHRGNRDFDEFKCELIEKNYDHSNLSTSTKSTKTKTYKKFYELAWALYIHYTETSVLKNV